jgi:hypothetical protein
MKKFFMMSMIAIAAAGMIGCGEEEGTTLRWKNQDSSVAASYVGIQWVDFSTTQANQTWDSVPAQDEFSPSKDVTALTGSGNVVDAGGTTAQIVLDDTDPDVAGIAVNGTSSVVLAKDSDATLAISSAKK